MNIFGPAVGSILPVIIGIAANTLPPAFTVEFVELMDVVETIASVVVDIVAGEINFVVVDKVVVAELLDEKLSVLGPRKNEIGIIPGGPLIKDGGIVIRVVVFVFFFCLHLTVKIFMNHLKI